MKSFKLVKERAKTEIIIKPDHEDDWFIYIIQKEKKSGKETSKTMIIQKDLNDFLEHYYDKGWVHCDINSSIDDIKPKKVKEPKVKKVKSKMPPLK